MQELIIFHIDKKEVSSAPENTSTEKPEEKNDPTKPQQESTGMFRSVSNIHITRNSARCRIEHISHLHQDLWRKESYSHTSSTCCAGHF